jgi:hypothetical protein
MGGSLGATHHHHHHQTRRRSVVTWRFRAAKFGMAVAWVLAAGRRNTLAAPRTRSEVT